MSASSGIIWLASYPKSGNTWFRIFLSNLVSGGDAPADINDLEARGGIASSRQIFEASTMLDSGLLSHDDIDLLRPRVYETMAEKEAESPGELRWIKVHDAYTRTNDGEPLMGRDVARAAIYLVRDPRDVAISSAHHNSTTIDTAIKAMNAPNSAVCNGRRGLAPQLRQKLNGWSGHVTSWLDQTDVPVHFVRYEDLRADPVKEFQRALTFAGRDATEDQISRAVKHADFSELQAQENKNGFIERMSRTAPFFRSGRAGGWREELTTEQIHVIESCHREVMIRLGYV